MNLKSITHRFYPYIIFAIFVAAFGFTYWWSDPLAWLEQVLAIERYWLSLIIYGLLMIIATVFAPLTVAITVPFMAKIFGPFAIFVVSWVGWMVGSIIIFFLCRRWGKTLVEKLFPLEKIEELSTKIPKHLDFWVLLLLRTFVPVDILSYAVGLLSTISFKKYVYATALGIVPFAFILSYGPDAISGGNPWLLFSFFALAFTIISAMFIFHGNRFFRRPVNIYTHDGKFHSDDVFAVAVVQLVLDQQQKRYRVIRTRDEKTLSMAQDQISKGKEMFIVDVGGVYEQERFQFDHHQKEGAGERENGVRYAALGLVWSQYGARLCDNNKEIADEVDAMFVQGVDGPDNGQELYSFDETTQLQPVTLYEIVEDYYRQHGNDNPRGQNEDFEQAVCWAKQLLPKIVSRATTRIEMKKRAGKLYAEAEDKRVIVTEEYVGRNYFTRFEDTLLVVSPRTGDINGDWSVVVVPEEEQGLSGRVSFPQEWWGMRDKELQEVSAIRGAKFVHSSGNFIAVANSRKSAIEMAQKVIENQR